METTATKLGRSAGTHLADRVQDWLHEEVEIAIAELGADHDHTDAELEQFSDDFTEAALKALVERL